VNIVDRRGCFQFDEDPVFDEQPNGAHADRRALRRFIGPYEDFILDARRCFVIFFTSCSRQSPLPPQQPPPPGQRLTG
jgi:hypothetical protein